MSRLLALATRRKSSTGPARSVVVAARTSKKKPKPVARKPSLASRMKANQRAQSTRLRELDKTDTLGAEDAVFRLLRREWDALEKEWDRQNAKRLSKHGYTVYSGSTRTTTTKLRG